MKLSTGKPDGTMDAVWGLVMADNLSGAVGATVLQSKADPRKEEALRRFLGSIGAAEGPAECTLRHDQEPVVEQLCRKVAAARQGTLSVQSTSAGSHQSNGMIERQIRELQGHIRTMRAALKEEGHDVQASSATFAWLVRHSVFVLNRFARGEAPCEKLTGQSADGLELYPYLAPVMVKQSTNGKLDERWSEGLWLGREDGIT